MFPHIVWNNIPITLLVLKPCNSFGSDKPKKGSRLPKASLALLGAPLYGIPSAPEGPCKILLNNREAKSKA